MGIVQAKSVENKRRFYEKTKVNQEQYIDKVDDEPRDIILQGLKARVDKIHVEGLSRTKDDIIEDCIRELFKAKDLEEVLLKAHRARLKLDELGCFKNIGIYIDTSKGIGASPDGLEITFNVTEYKRLTGGISTHVGNNEGSLSVALKTPNIFGRGERVQVEYSHGSKKTSNFNVAFIKPFRGSYHPILTASVFQSHSEWPPSGYKLLDRGLLFDFGFHSMTFFKHNIQWEGTVRDLSVLSRNTSFSIREQAGVSLRSALRHILSVDLRDDLIFPTTGAFFKLTSELSGLGGDVGYWKNEILIQNNIPLFEDIILQGNFTAGTMHGLYNDMKICLPDMYFLGGPTSIRGFETRGVGPHSDGNALGSQSYWASGLHLFTPLPFRPGQGGFGEIFKTHLFVTAGNIGDLSFKNLESLRRNLRLSYGMGIALRLGNMARLEINYCFPTIYEKGDQVHPGVQFGIGVQFL